MRSSPTALLQCPGTWDLLHNITSNGRQYPRQEHSVAALKSDVYVLGGILPFDGTTYPTIDVVQRLSTIGNTWSDLSPMPAALNHANVAVVDGSIYVLGGLAASLVNEPTFWNASMSCFVYDPVADIWSSLPSIPDNRAIGSAATFVVNSTIYLAGGLLSTNLTNDEERTVSYLTSYDTISQEWSILQDMPAPRDHAGAESYGQKLYVLGGRAFGHFNVVNTVFSYDVRTGMWSSALADMPTARGGCASGIIDGVIYIAGGEGDNATASGVYPQMEGYDVLQNEWFVFENMTRPVHGSAAAVVNGSFIVPGGGNIIGGGPVAWTSVWRSW